VYEKLITAGEKLSPLKRKLFFWALDLSLQYDIKGKSFFYNLKRKIADRLIFSKWRAALGGNIVAVVSGGAALQPRLARVFLCAKITVLEAYGLTETSPAISANNFEPDSICIGTVGPVLKNTQVKIAEDGEILVKGPGVMMGYYNNEEATREVLTEEGWFHTGDIGTLVEGRFLKITDRKKEIFKNSAGKYVAPLMIENHLKECRFIEQCMVIGEKQKFASALLVPAFDYIKEWSKHHGVDYSSNEQIIQNESLRKEISSFVREMNKSLAPHEQIKRPELISSLWTVEGGELTPKMSLRRKAIMEKYADQISKIYISEEE
jgi:long-chain acyl-CoA synthetase